MSEKQEAGGSAGQSRAAHFAPKTEAPVQAPLSAVPHVSAETGSESLRRVKRKRHKVRKRILIALAVVLSIFVVAGVAFGLWVNSLSQSMNDMSNSERQELHDALVSVDTENREPYYVLILGSDAREGDSASRSDVTMLARIDPSTFTVSLVSIPRDTMVTINGTTQKINAAYAFGGASGAVEAVSQFAGVDISHYVEVHFSELERVVDTLGGIWVNVPESFTAGNGGMSFQQGNQLLNGEQALAYARERYNVSGGDFGRAQAQRQIVEAIVKQVLAASPAQIPGLISQLASSITTDYSIADMGQLALDFNGTDMKMYSAACPSYSYNVEGVSYVGTMFDEWRAMMQRVDAGLDPNDTSAQIPEAQLSNERLGSAANSAAPRDYQQLAQSAGLTTDDVAKAE